MLSKKICFSLLALSAVAAVLVIGAERSRPANVNGIDPACTSASPCIEYQNKGNGPGLEGTSSGGNGSVGLTFLKSTSTANGHAGVFGGDYSTTGSSNSGVKGVSTQGTGVSAISNNIGLQATAILYPISAVGGYGFESTSATPAVGIVGGASPRGFAGDMIDACTAGTPSPCAYPGSVFRVDGFGDISTSGSVTVGPALFNSPAGDINITGQYLKSGTCVAGCTAASTSSPGKAVISYVPEATAPTIEDNGESQLVNGQAYVRIDPAFSNVIDQRSPYLVSITPEGDSNGLYVTQKSALGFAVRENHNGRSSLSFNYRIVAKRYGVSGARLPMVTLRAKNRARLPALHE